MELKTPGIGLPSAIACTAAVLYFTPLYIDGLAANWEILLFVIGIILLIFEFLVIPGFGIAGISGSILILGALILALVGNVNFDFNFVSAADISKGIITVISGVIISVALLFWFFQKIGSKGPLGRLALQADQATEKDTSEFPPNYKNISEKKDSRQPYSDPPGK